MNTKTTSGNIAARTNTSPLPHGGHDEPWRSKREVAVYYGMCARTIERAVAEEIDPMPHRRFRGRIMFRFSDIDRWLGTTQKYRVATRGGKRKPKTKKAIQVSVPSGLKVEQSPSHPKIPRRKPVRDSAPKPERPCSETKHRFSCGLYSRTCGRCGVTQYKDPGTGDWTSNVAL